MRSPHSTRGSQNRWAPLVQGGVGCVVLVILLALLNACGDTSPVASREVTTDASVAPGDAAARAVAGAMDLALQQQEDALLAGDFSGSVQVTISTADRRQLQLYFDEYSDDGVSFLHGALQVTWGEDGTPGFSGDLQIRVSDGAPVAAGLDGDVITLPGGGSMTLIIAWPTLSPDTVSAETDPAVTDPVDGPPTDADIPPGRIRLGESAKEVIWQTIRETAERGAGVYEGDASGRARVRLERSVTTSEEGSVIQAEANLAFERYGTTARFALGGELRLKYRRDTQGRSRAAVDGEIAVYTTSGVGRYTPDVDLVRQWLDTRFEAQNAATMGMRLGDQAARDPADMPSARAGS